MTSTEIGWKSNNRIILVNLQLSFEHQLSILWLVEHGFDITTQYIHMYYSSLISTTASDQLGVNIGQGVLEKTQFIKVTHKLLTAMAKHEQKFNLIARTLGQSL